MPLQVGRYDVRAFRSGIVKMGLVIKIRSIARPGFSQIEAWAAWGTGPRSAGKKQSGPGPAQGCLRGSDLTGRTSFSE